MAEIALVVDDPQLRRWLENMLVKAQHHVLFSCEGERLQDCHGSAACEPRLWLVQLPADSVEAALEYIEARSRAAVLLVDECPVGDEAVELWRRQVVQRLERELQPARELAVPPREVWLLGASLGGPEAVRSFLAELPATLPVAFVYVQHIEEAFDQALVTSLNRETPFRASVWRGDMRMHAGDVVVIPPEVKPRFLPFGRIIPASLNWRSQYRPCIDEVAEGLVHIYRQRLGLIIFSGTWNDGEEACRTVSREGGTVWAQLAETCLCATMPEAAIATGTVSFSGSPEDLARALRGRYTNQRITAEKTAS